MTFVINLMLIYACFNLRDWKISNDILKSQIISRWQWNQNHYVESRRIQYRPGKNGDPETVDLAVASVGQFADWTRSSVTLRQASHLTSGQTTSPSGQSAGKPIPSANVSGEFYLPSLSTNFSNYKWQYIPTREKVICGNKIVEKKWESRGLKWLLKKKNTDKFLTVKTGVNGATPTFPSAVTRIRWRSTWFARWSVIRVASGFMGCVGSPQRSTAISSTVIFTRKHPCAPRWSVCTTSAEWYRSYIQNGRTSSTGFSPPSFFMPGK